MGFLNSYLLDKKITFKSQAKPIRGTICIFRYCICPSMVINYYAHKFLMSSSQDIFPFLEQPLYQTIINFLGLKFLVFKKVIDLSSIELIKILSSLKC